MRRIDRPDPMPDAVAKTAPPGGHPPPTIAALGHCPTVLEPFLAWARALALEGALPRRDHELLALRAAHNCRSAFEWDEHSGFARRAGITDEEIDRIAAGPDADGWTLTEAALLRAADELHKTFTISRPTWATLVAHYEPGQLVEAIYVVGQYTMLSMVANVAEAD